MGGLVKITGRDDKRLGTCSAHGWCAPNTFNDWSGYKQPFLEMLALYAANDT